MYMDELIVNWGISVSQPRAPYRHQLSTGGFLVITQGTLQTPTVNWGISDHNKGHPTDTNCQLGDF